MIFVLLIIFLCLLFRLFPLSSFLQYSSVTLYHFVYFFAELKESSELPMHFIFKLMYQLVGC